MRTALAALTLLLFVPLAAGQPFGQGNQNQPFGNGNALNGGNALGNNGPNGFGTGQAGQGGGNNADFESLIDLIISTVAPESWAENGGGEAEVRPYVNGVYADAGGVLSRVSMKRTDSLTNDLDRLASVRDGAQQDAPPAGDPRSPSALRYISLGRLESELARRRQSAEPIDESMLTLAGLRRVQYVLLLPPIGDGPGDVVLAGPAGDWRVVGDGRIIDTDSGQSVVRLDDLLTLLRRNSGGPFGCSINPRPESLTKAQEFLNASQQKPVAPGKRDAWLAELRDRVGEQDIEVFGVAPTSRAAGVLVEADHHMKLIGMGLADGVPGVVSYLDGVANRREAPASTGVLRWWFGMNYTAVGASPTGDAFQIVGPGARVMSEKEMLDERGQRVAAGADPLAEEFASSFTRQFETLCKKHPVYSELRNLFDLALAVEIIRQGSGENASAWRPVFFLDAEALPLPEYEPARSVATVVNHRMVSRRRFIAGVSGGVWGDARRVLSAKHEEVERSGYGPLGEKTVAAPESIGSRQWWWDAAE